MSAPLDPFGGPQEADPGSLCPEDDYEDPRCPLEPHTHVGLNHVRTLAVPPVDLYWSSMMGWDDEPDEDESYD